MSDAGLSASNGFQSGEVEHNVLVSEGLSQLGQIEGRPSDYMGFVDGFVPSIIVGGEVVKSSAIMESNSRVHSSELTEDASAMVVESQSYINGNASHDANGLDSVIMRNEVNQPLLQAQSQPQQQSIELQQQSVSQQEAPAPSRYLAPITTSGNDDAGTAASNKRKRNPAFLNTRPKFWELNNDVLMADVFDALIRAQTEWLSAKDIQSLLEFCQIMKLGARAPHRPPSGSIFYFDSRAGEYFRRDGYDYIKKKGSGISVREDHVKLRQGTVAVIYASYVHSAEWLDPVSGASLFHRRSYWHVDTDESNRGVVVHYLGNQDANIEPMQRPHDVDCECVLCCLKRENSRPDRPGESLEQILSRAQKLIATQRPKKKRASSVSSQTSSSAAAVAASLNGLTGLPPIAQSVSTLAQSSAASELIVDSDQRKKKRRSKEGEMELMDGVDIMGDDPNHSNKIGAASPSPSHMFGSHHTDETASDDGRTTRMATKDNQVGWFIPGLPHHSHQTSSSTHETDSALGDDVLTPGMENLATDPLDSVALESLQGLLTPVQSRRQSEFDSIAAFESMFPPWSGTSFGERHPGSSSSDHGTVTPLHQQQQQRFHQAPPSEVPHHSHHHHHHHHHQQQQQQYAPPVLSQRKEMEEDVQNKIKTKKLRDPVTQKPATRFDFNNLQVAEVSPYRLRERERTLVVIGMARLPETLNHRTWTEKVFPRLNIWFGEYRIPDLINVALGVVAFECPPLFRSKLDESEHANMIVRCEGMTVPIPFSKGKEPVWDSATMPFTGGSGLKRARPSFSTPIRGEQDDRKKTVSPIGHEHRTSFSTRDESNVNNNEEEEEIAEEEEDLDRRATMMVERVVRLMTSSGASKDQVAEIINEVSPENGLNFLHTAVFCGASVEVIQMLLEHGADPNARTRDAAENTALHLACDQGNVPIARLLIRAGANASAVNAHGQTPFDAIMNREENEADSELFALLGVQPSTTQQQSQPQQQQQPSQHQSSSSQMFSPMRLSAASPRPGTPLRQPVSASVPLGDKDQHITLLRDALTSLSLQEQCALTLATSMSEERKTRRSTSVASTSDLNLNSSLAGSVPGRMELSESPKPALSNHPNVSVVEDGKKTGENVSMETVEEDAQAEDDVTRVVSEAQPSLLEALNNMSSTERAILDQEARRIQSNVRAWLLRRQFLQVREAAKKVQALAKGHLARRHFRELREKASATLVIQRSLRAHILAKKARQQLQQQQQQSQQQQQEISMNDSSATAPQITEENSTSSVAFNVQPEAYSGSEPQPQQAQEVRGGMIDDRRLSLLAFQNGNPMGPINGTEQHHPADSLIHSSEDIFMDGEDSVGRH